MNRTEEYNSLESSFVSEARGHGSLYMEGKNCGVSYTADAFFYIKFISHFRWKIIDT